MSDKKKLGVHVFFWADGQHVNMEKLYSTVEEASVDTAELFDQLRPIERKFDVIDDADED